ncbi:MAG TPA: hypothetical protein VJQ45_10100 [Ktedonobacterales bacterium]|nr:hypothetical protein [Ktedonobacterales bacterium]
MSDERDDQNTQAPGQQGSVRPPNDQPTAEELARGDWPNLEGHGESPADEAYATGAGQTPSNEQLESDLEADQDEQYAADEALQEGLAGPDAPV